MGTATRLVALLFGVATMARGATLRLESRYLTLEVNPATGHWALTDARSGARWPTRGWATAGSAPQLRGGFATATRLARNALRLEKKNGAAVEFRITDRGRSVQISYANVPTLTTLGDLLAITDSDGGYAIVPCREGLLVPVEGKRSFRRPFPTSAYSGCHMNMLGLVKGGSALLVTWDDAYVVPTLQRTRPRAGDRKALLTASFQLRRSAHSLVLTPLGKGDWNTLAAGYRRIAEAKGLAVTLRRKIRRNPKAELMVGAANVKLWTCLARRMNEESTAEEWVRVHWTFDEAAAIAEHIRKDLGIARCLFIMGGWTEGGYDCRHPDNLPANPECGGNKALARAIRRIQALGFLACLHDNYQDMYRDAKTWDPAYIEKTPKGELKRGGRWLGGRAYLVCAIKQLELASRPQNLPAIRKLFGPWAYFIDTTYAAGPQECYDPQHPLDFNADILWKSRLSDYARQTFGLFGSECGREWALPHSDFFEGLVGVAGRFYHSLKPQDLDATVIPFWEMVYHDCQFCYGKYGYSAQAAAPYVAHHVLCARPLHYHSFPEHLYWKDQNGQAMVKATPRVLAVRQKTARSFEITYQWDVAGDVKSNWRVFVHFGTPKDILFQDDHDPSPPTSAWRKGQKVRIGPRTVHVPPTLRRAEVNVYLGLFSPEAVGTRAIIPGADAQNRVFAGRLRISPRIEFIPAAPGQMPEAVFTRTDNGWAEGLHPTDVFLKNTHEVLGPLHAATAFHRLTRLQFLTPTGSLRRATYGTGRDATTVVVNYGESDAEVTTKAGGTVVLPPWGFVVEAPRFIAFYTRRWAGVDYPSGALFTIASLDGRRLSSSRRVRIFHGFGKPTLRWRGTTHQVRREAILEGSN